MLQMYRKPNLMLTQVSCTKKAMSEQGLMNTAVSLASMVCLCAGTALGFVGEYVYVVKKGPALFQQTRQSKSYRPPLIPLPVGLTALWVAFNNPLMLHDTLAERPWLRRPDHIHKYKLWNLYKNPSSPNVDWDRPRQQDGSIPLQTEADV